MAGLAARESRAGVINRHRVLKTAVVLSSVLFVLSAAAAIGQLAWSDRIDRRGGCEFDGYYYCLMPKGEVAPKPFTLPTDEIARNRDRWIDEWTNTVVR